MPSTSSFPCPYCKKAVFERVGHLQAHIGSARCLLNRVSAKRVMKKPVMKKPVVSTGGGTPSVKRPAGVIKNRGVCAQGNTRRTIRARIGPFIRYLRKNVSLSKAAGPPGTAVPFVPLDNSYVAADIALLAAAVCKAVPNPSHRFERLTAACTSAYFFTTAGTKLVGKPPKKWTMDHEENLRIKFIASWYAGEQLFNTAIQSHCSRSFLGLATEDLVDDAVDKILGVLRAIWYSCTVANICGSEGAAFRKDIGCPGMPADGYTQNLAICIWRYGLRGDRNIFSTDLSGLFLFPHQHRGVFDALAALTGEKVESLEKSAALTRLLLNMVSLCVAEQWKKHGGVVARLPSPKGLSPDELKFAFTEAVTHQLCEWHKAGMGEDALNVCY
jgi:hypothetical protein